MERTCQKNVCETCSKFMSKTPERRPRYHSAVVIVNFEQIWQIALVFPLLTLLLLLLLLLL